MNKILEIYLWLDFAGACLGVITLFGVIVFYMIKKIKNRKNK